MGAQPTTDRGRLTRQRIVAAATEVVAEKGALGASLDEVGARAPASRSQLYHYFDDKNDLLLAVAEATNDTVLDGQSDFFDDLDTWEGLVRWADALVASRKRAGREAVRSPISSARSASVTTTSAPCWPLGSTAGKPHPCRPPAMVESGELRPDADVAWLAASTLASVQGGLVLSQARRDPWRCAALSMAPLP